MKTNYLLCIAAALTLAATSCVNKDLDVLNKDIGGTVPVGGNDFAVYVGSTDSFRISKFIPEDNEYLIITDGKYRVVLKDTIEEKVPEVDSIAFHIDPDLDTNRMNMGNLNVPLPAPIILNEGNSIGGFSYNAALHSTVSTAGLIPTITIPISITSGSDIARVDTIFFTNASTVNITIDLTAFHNELQTLGSVPTTMYDESVTLSVKFPKGFLLDADDHTRIQSDTAFVLTNHPIGTRNVHPDSETFTFRVVHFVPSTNANFNGTIDYNIDYTNKLLNGDAANTAGTNIGMSLGANLTVGDVAITTKHSMPFEIKRMVFAIDANMNVPPEIERIDSIQMAAGKDIMWIVVDDANFPFKFVDTVGQDGASTTSGVPTGRIALDFPDFVRLEASVPPNVPADGELQVLPPSNNRFIYQPKVNTLFGDPTLKIIGLNIDNSVNSGYNPDAPLQEDIKIAADSLILHATTVYLKSTSLRRSQLETMQSNPPFILTGLGTDVMVERVMGAFNVPTEQLNVAQSFNFSDMLGSLKNIDTLQLAFGESTEVNFKVTNPTGMKLSMPFKVTAYRDGIATVSEDPLTVEPAPNPNTPRTTENSIDISAILRDLPDSLSIKVEPQSGTLHGQTIFLGTEEKPVTISYSLDVPIKFSEDFKIVYFDTISLGSGTDELLPKGITGSVGFLLGFVKKNMPVGLGVKIIPFDKDYQVLSNLEVKLDANIPADQDEGELRFMIGESKSHPGELSKLKSFGINVRLLGSSANAELTTNGFVQLQVYLQSQNLSVDLDEMNK